MAHLHRFPALFLLLALLLATQPVIPADVTTNNTEVAIAEALKERLLPEQIAGHIVNLVQSEDYNGAEHILSDLQVSKPMDIDGHRLLEKVYLLLSHTNNVHFLDRWCKNSPSSHFPFTIRGMYYYEGTRFLDGSNQTLLLNVKQRRNFNLYLRKAQADLNKAYELDPDAPGPSATLAALSIQLKQPRLEMEKWFARGVTVDPAWLGSYRAKLIYLAPWRHGSDQMMEQFALQCFENTSPDSNTFIVTLDWIKLKSDRLGTSMNGLRFLTDSTIYSLMSKGLNRYIDAFPLSPRIESYRLLEKLVLGQPYVSVAAFSDGLQQHPENTELLKGRISTYLSGKQFKPAETDIQKLEQLEGHTPFSRVSRAEVLYRSRHNLDEATRLYDQAIAAETSPYRRKHYLLNRAEINRNYGRHSLAINDFTAALEEDVLFEEAYLGRAKSHYALGDFERALAELVILKSHIRGRLTTHARSLINTYMKAERDKIASREPETPIPTLKEETDRQLSEPAKPMAEPSDNAYREYLIRGLQRFYQKDYIGARQDFYRTIASNPLSAKAYFMLGQIAEQVALDHTKARVLFEQALRLEPTNPDYLLSVSRSRYRDKDFTSILDSLSSYLADMPELHKDAQTTAQLYLMRGLCLGEQGLIPEAVNDMQEALRLDPQLKAAAIFIKDHTPESKSVNIDVQPIQYISGDQSQPVPVAINQMLQKGRQFMMNGDGEQARATFLKVIRLKPDISESYHQLGRISFEFDHDYLKARHYYSQAIDSNPGNPQYYFDRAAIHYYFRQYDLAVNDFTKSLDLQPNNEQSIYYRGVCNHMLGNIEAARRDFKKLRKRGTGWDIEINRFRNAWNTEIDQFLNTVNQ